MVTFVQRTFVAFAVTVGGALALTRLFTSLRCVIESLQMVGLRFVKQVKVGRVI